MKEKNENKTSQDNEELLKNKLNIRNIIKGIQTCAIHFVRYSGAFLKWKREERKQMKPRTRKIMTTDNAFTCQWCLRQTI